MHRIPVEKGPLLNGNSMKRIEYRFKGPSFKREFVALHRIPVERPDALHQIPLQYTQIRCSASNPSWKAHPFKGNLLHSIELPYSKSRPFNGNLMQCTHWNLMQCIEFPLKGCYIQLEFDALHRIPVESKGLSTGTRYTTSNSSVLNWFDAVHRIPYWAENKLQIIWFSKSI